MARPTKQGIDYFPLDVHLDDKFKFVQIKYGLEGFAIAVKLYQTIYSYGFWYGWTEDEVLLFSDEIRANYDVVNNVVNECINRGLFDKNLYEKYQILTSRGIQKRYFDITKRRTEIEVVAEYLLIEINNTNIKLINVCNNPVNADRSTQSKVKESIVKESREARAREGFDSFWSVYPKKKAKGDAEKAFSKLKPDAELLKTMLDAIKAQSRSPDWTKDGGQFIPHPATWLNQRRWEDEVTQPPRAHFERPVENYDHLVFNPFEE